MKYGGAPRDFGVIEFPEFTEYMHYMYLPVAMRGSTRIRLPERLEFLRGAIEMCEGYERLFNRQFAYIYVTARRGWATPGNPLNRPGWHSDGFGTDDINYVWTDAFPTRYAVQEFENISTDHIESAEQFARQVRSFRVFTYSPSTLLRLDAGVIHAAPDIPAPGGERGFIKISFSDSRYNLKGNSHNYAFNYNWNMHDRALLRNDPSYAGGDSGPQS